MDKINRIRLPIDIMMTLVSIVLMGGNFLFPAEIVHEILGVGLFVLWSVHIFLNRRWYGAIFKGKYNPYRIMQTVINCCILICTIFLMISGIILSNHLFIFFEYSERSWVCQNRPSAFQSLVLSFYVAAYRPLHGTTFSECCSKNLSTHSSCSGLCLRSLRLHRPGSLEISCFKAAVFLL